MTPTELEQMFAKARAGDSTAFGLKPSGVTAKDYLAPKGAPSAAPPVWNHPAVGKIPVKNQQGGTCVGNSISLCLEYLEYSDRKEVLHISGEELNGRIVHVEGAAASPPDVLDDVVKHGANVADGLSEGLVYAAAYAAVDWHDPEAVRAAMTTPGTMLTGSFWLEDEFGQDPSRPYDYHPGMKADAYHELTLVGYDAVGPLIQNSWGTWWCNNGFIRVTWAYIQNHVDALWAVTDSPDTAGGFIKTYDFGPGTPERAVKHTPTPGNSRPAVYLVKTNGRIWITDPWQAKRMAVDLSKVEVLPDTDPVWALPTIGPDAPLSAR